MVRLRKSDVASGFRILGMRGRTAAIAATLTVAAATQLWPEHRSDSISSGQSSAHVGDVVTGRVVRVSDGDTIVILRDDKSQLKIRMLGIDAPEKAQPFGNVCRETLAKRIAGKDVSVQVGTLDRYGRTIGKISVDGKDVNLAQIEDGCAWHYKDFVRNQPPADRELYAEKELEARDRKVGLWKDPHPQEPWAYRKAKRAEAD